MADYVLGSWWVGVSVAGHWQKNLLWHPFGALTKKTLIKAYGKTGPWLLVWIFFVKDGCTHGIAGIVFMNQLPSWKKTTRAWNLVLWKMNFPSQTTDFQFPAFNFPGCIGKEDFPRSTPTVASPTFPHRLIRAQVTPSTNAAPHRSPTLRVG